MDAQLKISPNLYLLILVLLTSHLASFAQKPPTAGPNPPPESTNLAPIIAGGGIVLGAATYFYVKTRGPKLAVQEHLTNYLLSRNILPTPDARDLMVELNPRLSNKQVMRANKKLIDPDFPEIPKSLLSTGNKAALVTSTMPATLKEQVVGFTSHLNTFRNSEVNIATGDQDLNRNSLNSILNEIEINITSPDRYKEESNTIRNQLMTDLLQVLNQTLEKSIAAKSIGEENMVLIKEISENITELLLPDINNTESSSLPYSKPSGDGSNLLLASIDPMPILYTFSMDKESRFNGTAKVGVENGSLLQGFAFAVHKITADGAVITKGPEVEGKYLIKYVSPALKNFPEAYHNLSSLATYASAYLPPAKLFVVVEDVNGNPVKVGHPLIDFKDAFKNPQQEKVNEMIIVPLKITDD